MLETSTQAIWRWKRGARPDSQRRDRLLDLRWIVERLSDVYRPDDANVWLFSRNALLHGDRPADRIRDGKIDDVIELVDQLNSGAYL